jgi:hypothetical protein
MSLATAVREEEACVKRHVLLISAQHRALSTANSLLRRYHHRWLGRGRCCELPRSSLVSAYLSIYEHVS